MSSALCGRDAIGVELAGDLAQRLAGGVRCLDPFDDQFGESPRAASERGRTARPGGSAAFGDESFKFVDRDQSCAPRHLDRLYVGEHRRRKVERLTPSASAAWLRV